MDNLLKKDLEKHLIDSLMNLATDGIAIVDPNGIVIEVNKKFEELHGWSREEVIGRFLPTVPEHHRPSMFRRYQSWINGEQVSNFEAERMRKDGSKFYADITVSPVIDDNGKVIAFIGIERDISVKKKAEKELLVKERQFRNLIKLNPEAIVLHHGGNVHFVNDSGCKLLGGLSSDDFAGRSIYEFFSPEDRELIKDQMEKVVQSDDYTGFREYRIRRLDGTFIDVEISSIYVHKDLETPIVQTVIRDLTERKKAEEMIIRSEKLSLIGQLAAGIAHDIRNPLTSLKGFLQLLKSNNIKYVDLMMEEVEHIHYVVNEFMTLAKPHLTTFTENDIRSIAQNVIHFMLPQANLYNVQIDMEMDDNLPLILCVPDQIKQVLINILKNAIESMPEGGTIHASVKNIQNQYLLIRVQDQGIGIPEEKISLLGDPFYTTKTNGTGLGLMICKRIIDAHQGTFGISSKVNRGTVVEIKLPFSKSKGQRNIG
jgi:two-component system sporulation sensor kinase A